MTTRVLYVIGWTVGLLGVVAGLARAQDGSQVAQDIAAPRAAAGTAFTYQGQLKQGSTPVTAQCDLQLGLWDALTSGTQVGVTQTTSNVSVANGLFTTQLDFGSNVFNGEARWLAMAVRCPAGSGSYTPLTPRQPLTPAPMALALPGLYTQQDASSPNLIGGYSGNSVTAGVYGATIGGGGESGSPNSVSSKLATIGGGSSNTVGSFGYWAVVGGGNDNNASGMLASVGGGGSNSAGNAYATVSGGGTNVASGDHSTVGGGGSNTASGFAATIPGGEGNSASADHTFAAGHNAVASHSGAFVWADHTGGGLSSTAANQFLVRASGGVGINTNSTTANNLTVNGQIIGGGTGVPAGSAEPFVARGLNSGISLDDRGNAGLRWVVYVNGGALRFYNGSDRMFVQSDGVLSLGALGSAGSETLCRNPGHQIATCASSLRYKRNVANLELGLDTVLRLRPVAFDWKGTGEPDLGFVAEEVNQVTPLLTTRNAAGEIEGVKYDRISAVLVSALQEQQKQIADLIARNARLEARLARLEQGAGGN